MVPRINGNFHMVLVVKDMERSAEWYGKVFGFVVVRKGEVAVVTDAVGRDTEFDCISLYHFSSRLFLGLAQPKGTEAATFDLRRAGLQHFGFHVEERSELDDWARHLEQLGIEHSPMLEEGPGLLVRFLDPDGIPVEIFWADGQEFMQRFTDLARSRAREGRERRQRRNQNPS